MLTRSGWAAVVIGAALIALAVLFGPVELWVIGLGAIAVPLLSALWLWVRSPSVLARRTIGPARVFAGSSSRIEVTFRNESALPSPVLRIVDRLGQGRDVQLELPPIPRRDQTAAGYRLPAERRGVVSIGPLRIEHSDPFGLAQRSREALAPIDILVYPRIDQIPAPPRPPGDDLRIDQRRTDHLGRSSNEFFALREYVVGDDLRRVHWASTARSGELMIRQDEQPQQGRTTVVMDTRTSSASPAIFEQMVSATASVVTAAHERDDLVRLVTTAGYDSGFQTSLNSEPNLDFLARVGQSSSDDLASTISTLSQSIGSSVVAIFGQGGAHGTTQLGASIPATVLCLFGSGATSTGSDNPVRSRIVMPVGPNDDFAVLWRQAMIRLASAKR